MEKLQLITDIFSRNLNTDCKPDENYFDLGGDSLTSEAILTEIEEAFSLSLPSDIFFEAPTPREICDYLENL